MNKITTLPALKALQGETMIYALIVLAVAIILSVLFASLVPYKGGNDKSYVTRRIIFIITGLAAAASFFLYNDLAVKPSINNIGWQNMFSKTNLIWTAIIFVGYLLIGIILMFVFRHSKYGSILGKEK